MQLGSPEVTRVNFHLSPPNTKRDFYYQKVEGGNINAMMCSGAFAH